MPVNNSVLLTLASGTAVPVAKILERFAISEQEFRARLDAMSSAGLRFEIDQNQRIRWKNPFECLDAEKICDLLGGNVLKVEVRDTVASTNSVLRGRAVRSPLLLASECQTRGRGRGENVWLMEPGKGLAFSLAWCIRGVGIPVPLSLLAGAVVAECLRDFGIPDVGLKWPNDVYLGGRKVAGILVESVIRGDETRTVLGIGLNVTGVPDVSGCEIKPVSLERALGSDIDRNLLLAQLARALVADLFEAPEPGEAWLQRWQRFDLLAGQAVSWSDGERTLEGHCHGINPEGHLVVEYGSKLLNLSDSSVSVRIRS